MVERKDEGRTRRMVPKEVGADHREEKARRVASASAQGGGLALLSFFLNPSPFPVDTSVTHFPLARSIIILIGRIRYVHSGGENDIAYMLTRRLQIYIAPSLFEMIYLG